MVRIGLPTAVLMLCAALAAGCGDRASTKSSATTAEPVVTQSATTLPATAPSPRPKPVAAHRSKRPARPTIRRKYLPFGAQRKRDMAAYARRHYGLDDYHLVQPRVIVVHFTVNDSVQATYDTFAPNVRDVELHELPGVCSHFVVAKSGGIYQLVPLGLMCRHTVGLNYTALGIEHVGRSDAEILGNRRQLAASLRLTTWLRCRFDIQVKNVIGHNESLSSPFHRERVARLRSQTHEDFTREHMQIYRRKLRRLACA
ncbi:hypothetical protein BH20ACT17_BH20ACT17_15640 [soil metagenome]